MAVQPRRILIALDDSGASWRALDAAVQMTGYGSTLAVVNVTSDEGASSELLARARAHVHRGQVAATYLQRMGDPAEEILAAAHELDAELVVVGRRAEDAADPPAPGSVSATVVRRAACDVLVIS